MIETISKKVSTQQEQNTINLMTTFGWRLKSSQEINSKESHLERRGDSLYSVTTKENYVKLLFERNTAMRNYDRIVQLERKYHALLNQRPKPSIIQILGVIGLLLLCFPIGIVYGIVTFKKFYDQGKKWGEILRIKGEPILAEVRTLL